MMIKKIWSNEFFRGGVFFTVSSFLINGMNYVFNFMAGRSLGPGGYGEIIALFSYLSITTVPIYVFSNFLVQKIAEAKENNAVLAKSYEILFWRKLRRLLIICLLFIPATPFIAKLTNLSAFLSFSLILLIALIAVSSVYASALQGMQLFFLFSLIGVISTFIKLLGSVLVFAGVDGIYTIVLFIFISVVFGILMSINVFNSHIRQKKIKKQPELERGIVHLFSNRQFHLIFASSFGLTLFNNIDIAFVKKFFYPVDAGIYSSWSLFAKIIFYILGPLISIVFIFFSSKQSKKTEKRTLAVSLFFLFTIGVGSFLAYSYIPKFIIDIFFGEKFYPVIPYLAKASIFGTFYSAITLFNTFFLAKKKLISFLTPISVLFYIFFLFLVNRNLNSIMDLNIYFSLGLFLIYFASYVKTSFTKT